MKNFFILGFVLLILQCFSQETKQQQAEKLLMEAIELMDNGKIKESITLLKKAKKLDPSNLIYDYEIGLAYVYNKEYSKAVKYYKKILYHPDATDQVWQMLGNTYSMMGLKDKAMETYQEGLKRFPNSGRLYLEQGIVMVQMEKYDKAIEYWIKGIQVDPMYPSSYHKLFYVLNALHVKTWALIYGEILFLLEPSTSRSLEIRTEMYNIFASLLTKHPNKQNSLIDTSQYGHFRWSINVFQPLMLTAIQNIEKISISDIHQIRTEFIKLYYEHNYHNEKPIALFEYHKKMIDAGVFEAYNYLMFAPGNMKEFIQWRNLSKEQLTRYSFWLEDNPFLLNSENYIIHTRYE